MPRKISHKTRIDNYTCVCGLQMRNLYRHRFYIHTKTATHRMKLHAELKNKIQKKIMKHCITQLMEPDQKIILSPYVFATYEMNPMFTPILLDDPILTLGVCEIFSGFMTKS